MSTVGRIAILLVIVLAGCGVGDKPVAAPQGVATAPAVQPDSKRPGTQPVSKPNGSSAANPDGSGGSGSRSVKSKETAKPVPPAILPRFANVSEDSGVRHTFYSDSVPDRYFLPEIMGGGVGWIDYDGDGLLDLYLANGCRLKDPDRSQMEQVSRIFRNLGAGRFADVTERASGWHNGYGQGIAVGDFDADGFPDLFYACYGADVLFHNNGDGTFDNVTKESGTTDDDWSSSAAWFDADGDGDLDLYVMNYMDVTLANYKICHYQGIPGYCGPGDYSGVPDRLFLNQGDGTFVDGLADFGMTAADGKGLAVSILDFDLDLRPEIYVANDMAANFLFTRGDTPLIRKPAAGRSEAAPSTMKRYAEVGLVAGCAVSNMGLNEASMGISCADFDGDGLPDIYLTHFYNSKNTLYHNLGKLGFVDDSFRTRAAATSFLSLGFGTFPIDYDQDGAPDLFIANGHVLGPKLKPYEMTPQLLRNDGHGRLDDISEYAGPYFKDEWVGRSVAAGDFDNDGDLDIVVSHLHRPVALLRNDTVTGRHFLGLQLRTRNRIPPIGGRVHVVTSAGERVLPIQAGGSYLGSSDSRLVFGTGETTDPPRIEIHWTSGQVQRFDNLAVDRYWIVYEDEAPLSDPLYDAQGLDR